MNHSGKLVILGIVAVALASAAASWWFRYSATHRAARFWGADAAELIRDAPLVLLLQNPPPEASDLAERDPRRAVLEESVVDVSKAPGLLHLRNALLEDRSFQWPTSDESSPDLPLDASGWQEASHWQLVFFDRRTNINSTQIIFSGDCRQALIWRRAFMGQVASTISTKPIAEGLRTLFAEMWNNASEPQETTR